ncbi:MAG: hypothetical protein NTX52_15500, partial [Planctomycetota bacterium]|nr:hypothetical protein [Planctomycetota bacterium]
WKTETVEAMTAFRKKPGYTTGAGECVSLSRLYAAAAFIICGIPLEDIYMVLTPLHSQNFIDISDGVLTNNRRLVTKAMWFNGTEISNKAQRALRYEQITVIAHCSGYTHCIYPQATIDRKVYDKFTGLLKGFLTEKLNPLIFANFLRSQSGYQKYFQFCRRLRGEQMFVMAEELFGYEHGSRFRIADETFDKLLEEVSEEDYSQYKFDDRLCCEQLMNFVNENSIDVLSNAGRAKLAEYLASFVPDSKKLVAELADFIHLEPKLPTADKQYATVEPIRISPGWTREQIIEYLRGKRQTVAAADLAFYAYRDMESCDWEPFVKAAIDRSPVSIEAAKDLTIEQVYQNLRAMPDESIYDGKRLAQPDEVQNYGTGDGVEKAFLLANIICAKEPDRCVRISIDNSNVIVKANKDYHFASTKGLKKEITAAS